MNWHWKVRIHNASGHYGMAQFSTGRELRCVDEAQDFYFTLTGCKMLLEGMSEHPFENVPDLCEVFNILWKETST